MKKAFLIFSPFKTLIESWWYKLLSFGASVNPEPFLSHLAGILCALSILVGCSTIKYVPVEQESKVVERQVVKDSIVYVEVPVERVLEVCPELDTLKLETSVAFSITYLDTLSKSLKGKLENKSLKISKDISIKEKTIEKEVIKEIPIEVTKEIYKTPKWAYFTLIISIIFVILIFIKIYLKIKK